MPTWPAIICGGIVVLTFMSLPAFAITNLPLFAYLFYKIPHKLWGTDNPL